MLLVLAVGTVLAAAVIATARGNSSDGSRRPDVLPTEEEARRVLLGTHERAIQTADAASFCAVSAVTPTCINQYNDRGGRGTVPPQPPQVVAAWRTDDLRVLTVCGVDGRGDTYRADFPVRRERDGSLAALLDVFWDSKTFSGSVSDGQHVSASPGTQQFSC